jgi:hypothetical protein
MRHSSCRTTLDIYTRAVDQQKREANLKVVDIDAAAGGAKTSAPFCTLGGVAGKILASQAYVNKGFIGGPDRDRTDDLFHAMIGVMGQIIDGTVLTNRHNRQN